MLRAPRTSRFAIDPFKGHTDALYVISDLLLSANGIALRTVFGLR
jgi:hypothetical protein